MNYIKLLIITSLISSCAILPEKNTYTEININSPIDKVWDALADIENYHTWNPYHIKVQGKLALGEKLKVNIHKPNGVKIEIEPYVMKLERNKILTWGGGVSGIFKGIHVFELISLQKNKTKLIHRERFSGIAIPFASLDAIEEGYNQMNKALKKKLEMPRLK